MTRVLLPRSAPAMTDARITKATKVVVYCKEFIIMGKLYRKSAAWFP